MLHNKTYIPMNAYDDGYEAGVQRDVDHQVIELLETAVANRIHLPDPPVRDKAKKSNYKPWNDYDHTFKTGDRFLVKKIKTRDDDGNFLHDVTICETCGSAIKTVEYGWLLKTWRVDIIEFLDIYKTSLIEKGDGKN